jgi:hypothetical protein
VIVLTGAVVAVARWRPIERNAMNRARHRTGDIAIRHTTRPVFQSSQITPLPYLAAHQLLNS